MSAQPLSSLRRENPHDRFPARTGSALPVPLVLPDPFLWPIDEFLCPSSNDSQADDNSVLRQTGQCPLLRDYRPPTTVKTDGTAEV
jgi:hypothetical protein